jgi:lysophospholipase L1-like esterase
LNENRYIGFGDSITYGTINHNYYPEKGYIPRLDAILDLAFGPTEVINEGLGGEETSMAVLRLDYVLAVYRARYILIMEGTNDVTFLRPVESITANLRSLLTKSLDAGLLPAIATVIPRRDFRWAIPAHRDLHLAMNAAIRLMAPELGVPLVDLYDIFTNYANGGAEALLSEDLKHPNEKGYQVMAEAWAAAIKQYPFPPVQVQVRRDSDKILFYRRPGNMVAWRPNPKASESGMTGGYKVYRRKRGEGKDQFVLLSRVSGLESYFDTAITPGTIYEYIVSAFRPDGMEGPASNAVIF